jgi:hypothetical protein
LNLLGAATGWVRSSAICDIQYVTAYDVVGAKRQPARVVILRTSSGNEEHYSKCYIHLPNIPFLEARLRGLFRDGVPFYCIEVDLLSHHKFGHEEQDL